MITLYTEDHFPDVIYMQSTFWDITRYGDGIEKYGQRFFPQYTWNLRLLVDHVDKLWKKEELRRAEHARNMDRRLIREI